MQVMNRGSGKLSAVLAMCGLLAAAGGPAQGQKRQAQPPELFTGGIGPSNAEIVGVVAGIAALGAAIGIGVYFAVKHNHRVTGCARSGPDGMTLTSESDKQTYALVGEVAGIKSGDRVRVSGKKSKDQSSGTRHFLVEKVSKDLGACEASSATR